MLSEIIRLYAWQKFFLKLCSVFMIILIIFCKLHQHNSLDILINTKPQETIIVLTFLLICFHLLKGVIIAI